MIYPTPFRSVLISNFAKTAVYIQRSHYRLAFLRCHILMANPGSSLNVTEPGSSSLCNSGLPLAFFQSRALSGFHVGGGKR